MSNSFLCLLFHLPVSTFELRVETSTSLLEEIRQLAEFLPRYAEFLQGLFLPTWLFVAYLVLLYFQSRYDWYLQKGCFFLDLVLRPDFTKPHKFC